MVHRETGGNTLNLLFFSSKQPGGMGDKLQMFVEAFVADHKAEICRTVSSLSARLRKRKYDLDIAVLVTEDENELDELLAIRELLDDLRIILVLPDEEKETVSKGCALYPRFLTCVDSDFTAITDVLNNMLTNYPIRPTGQANGA